MSLIKNLWKTLTGKAAGISTNTTFQIVNGQIINSADNKRSYLNNGYSINDTIYSIVQLITEKVRVAPWGVYKVTDEDALKKYQAILSKKNLSGEDIILAKKLRKKAIEPYTADAKLNELLDYPNPDQTFSDLVADSSIFKLLTGDRIIWAETLQGGANQGKPQSLNILPSQFMTIVVNKDFPMRIIGYKVDDFGLINLPVEQILHDKYYNPNWCTSGEHLYGLSPLKAALQLVDRSNSENKMSTAYYQNGGPRTVLFVDEPTIPDFDKKGKQAAAIKQILQGKEYVGPNNGNKLATSGAKMGAVPLGLTPVELAIIESEKWSMRRLCNVFGGVPSQLLNDPENRHYNNYVEGERALTSRCALPLLTSFRNKFNQALYEKWGYKDKNIYCDFDLTVYSELQEDLKEKWTWVERLPVDNGYKLDLMGLDHPEGQEEFMKQILIPTGFETSENVVINETDRALEEGDGEVSENQRGKDLSD